MADNRKHTRFTVLCNAGCINTEVTVIDISREGMRIRSSHFLEHKRDISFSIVLPNLDIIKILGDIKWHRQFGENEYQYGVLIKELSEEHETTFLSFLKELEIKDIK